MCPLLGIPETVSTIIFGMPKISAKKKPAGCRPIGAVQYQFWLLKISWLL
jgi:hypothetical protein